MSQTFPAGPAALAGMHLETEAWVFRVPVRFSQGLLDELFHVPGFSGGFVAELIHVDEFLPFRFLQFLLPRDESPVFQKSGPNRDG